MARVNNGNDDNDNNNSGSSNNSNCTGTELIYSPLFSVKRRGTLCFIN